LFALGAGCTLKPSLDPQPASGDRSERSAITGAPLMDGAQSLDPTHVSSGVEEVPYCIGAGACGAVSNCCTHANHKWNGCYRCCRMGGSFCQGNAQCCSGVCILTAGNAVCDGF
jgi:hypothetical protein